MTNKPWIVRTCKLEDLENNLNEIEQAGYVIEDKYIIPESFFWVIIAHIVDGINIKED